MSLGGESMESGGVGAPPAHAPPAGPGEVDGLAIVPTHPPATEDSVNPAELAVPYYTLVGGGGGGR